MGVERLHSVFLPPMATEPAPTIFEGALLPSIGLGCDSKKCGDSDSLFGVHVSLDFNFSFNVNLDKCSRRLLLGVESGDVVVQL